MKIIILVVFTILLPSFVYADVIINEIMYNPEGSDSGHEWVEIYSSKEVNLSEWKFFENDANHGLILISGSWIVNGYAVIVDEYDLFLSDYQSFNGTLLDSSWSSLSNSGEYIAIKNKKNEIVDGINYSTEFANANGK